MKLLQLKQEKVFGEKIKIAIGVPKNNLQQFIQIHSNRKPQKVNLIEDHLGNIPLPSSLLI